MALAIYCPIAQNFMTWLGIKGSLYIYPYFLYVMTNKFKKYLYDNEATFSSKCETVALQVAYAWMAKLFSKWGHKCI